MDLMKLIKGTDIGDCVARLLFTWNADHPDAEKAKETFISAIKARMPQQARLNLSSAEKLSDSIDRYLIKNDTEMYAAVKIGSAMMLAALANRETPLLCGRRPRVSFRIFRTELRTTVKHSAKSSFPKKRAGKS